MRITDSRLEEGIRGRNRCNRYLGEKRKLK